MYRDQGKHRQHLLSSEHATHLTTALIPAPSRGAVIKGFPLWWTKHPASAHELHKCIQSLLTSVS